MPEWLTYILFCTAGFLIASFYNRTQKNNDELPEKYVTKKECEEHRANCAGPGWITKFIEEQRLHNSQMEQKFSRLIGGLEAKGILAPEKKHD